MSTIIKAELVKILRDKTNVSMMECKRALEKTNGDIEEAIDLLRKSGEATAIKKQSRVAAEGLVVVAQLPNTNQASIVEVNCETDFVAKNNNLLNFANQIAQAVLTNQVVEIDNLSLHKLSDGYTIDQVRLNLISQLGENIILRRVDLVQASTGEYLGVYRHGSPVKIACIVCLQGGDANLAKDVAMHVAAMRPEYIDQKDIPKERYEKELEIFTEQTHQANNDKPEDILQKIIVGRVNKFFKEITLLDQIYIKDQDLTIKQLLSKHKAKIVKVSRFEIGRV